MMNQRKIPLDDLNFNFKSVKSILIAVIIGVVVVLAILFRPFTVIPAGHRGVIFNQFKGVDKNRVLNEGFHFIVPFVESVEKIEVRVQKEDFQAASASKDLQEVKASLAVNYHLDPQKVAIIYQEVGTDFQAKLISPFVQEAIKAVTAQYNATELISKRPEVKNEVFNYMHKRLKRFNIIVDDVSITDFTFSPRFMESIEAKQVAEQEALKKKFELQKAKQDAAIEIARAKGAKKATIARAEGQAREQELLKKSVSAEIIRLKEIEAQMKAIKKWDGRMPSVTGGSMPMFNIKGMIK